MAIRPPWVMFAIMSRSAPACRTSPARRRNPRACPAALRLGDRSRSATLTARVTPILRARSSRYCAQVGDHHVARAGVPGDRRGHDADRPGAGDQHVLAEHRERQRGVHGVAERIEDRGDLRGRPGAVCTQTLVAGRATYSANAPSRCTPSPGVDAQVTSPGAAVAAAAADQVPLAADDVTDVHVDTRRRPRPPRRRTRARPYAAALTVPAAHSSQASMCRSVPQIPVARTATSTSPGPTAGTSMSSSSSPGPGRVLTSAFTGPISHRRLPSAGVHVKHEKLTRVDRTGHDTPRRPETRVSFSGRGSRASATTRCASARGVRSEARTRPLRERPGARRRLRSSLRNALRSAKSDERADSCAPASAAPDQMGEAPAKYELAGASAPLLWVETLGAGVGQLYSSQMALRKRNFLSVFRHRRVTPN